MPVALSRAGFDALWHPELLLAAIALGIVYWQVTGPLRERFPDAAAPPLGRRLLFLTGVATLYLAQGSPIEILANRYLLSAHMVQAVLLLFTAPPLLLLGTPEWLLRPVFRLRWLRETVRFLTHPLRALFLFVVVFSFYLFPTLTEGALANPWLYLLEHVLSVFAALLMWWPLASPLPELPPLTGPLQMLYTFLVEVLMTFAFALVTFSPVPFYPTYAHGAPLVGIPALDDQEAAGAIMRVGSMLSYGFIFARAFRIWVRNDEAGMPPEMHMPRGPDRPATRGEGV